MAEPRLLSFVTLTYLFLLQQNYANLIPGATVGVLASDSRNILELIMTAYKVNRRSLWSGFAGTLVRLKDVTKNMGLYDDNEMVLHLIKSVHQSVEISSRSKADAVFEPKHKEHSVINSVQNTDSPLLSPCFFFLARPLSFFLLLLHASTCLTASLCLSQLFDVPVRPTPTCSFLPLSRSFSACRAPVSSSKFPPEVASSESLILNQWMDGYFRYTTLNPYSLNIWYIFLPFVYLNLHPSSIDS